MNPFEETDRPLHHTRSFIVENQPWFTWSREARQIIREFVTLPQHLISPSMTFLPHAGFYNYTYAVAPSADSTIAAAMLRPIAEALFGQEWANQPILLCNLFPFGMQRPHFMSLFALLRGELARLAADESLAMYAPLGATGRHQSEFRLHCDLYRAPILFNVFDQVAKGNGGATLLLSIDDFFDVLSRSSDVPHRCVTQFMELLDVGNKDDRFTPFYSLLYGDAPWQKSISLSLEAIAHRIKLHRGEGYLVHDRQWLHGRTATNEGIPEHRLHRLVFTPQKYVTVYADHARSTR